MIVGCACLYSFHICFLFLSLSLFLVPTSSSSLIGVATEKEKRRIFGDTSRSISFLHTERIVSTVPKGDGRDEEVAMEEKRSTSEAVRTAGTGRTREESVPGQADDKLGVSKDKEEPQLQAAQEVVEVSMCCGIVLSHLPGP